MTMPVVASTVCLLPVTLFRFGDATSRITGVPRPDGNASLSMGEVFSKMVPAVPENGQPVSGAVAYTWTRLLVESSISTGRVWQSAIVANVARDQPPVVPRLATTICGADDDCRATSSRPVLITAQRRPEASV